QQARLARWAGSVRWHEALAEALAEARGAALIFSNEFADAFPCARWVFDPEAGWREVWVAWDEASGQVEERAREVVCAARRQATSVGAMGAGPGQQAEVFESYRRWLGEGLAGWERGRLLTIDYGDWLPALYRRRPAGTLRAYCRQMRFAGAEVYARIGQQDLTADVNFTDLERWGAELGLATAAAGTQAEFLRRWLPPGRVREAGRDAQLAFLLDRDGAGGAFKFLEQTRG
ncbi:MAG: SAM-dependent methyltransferase, partial [Gluconacetobacter diazotrophicus]|nr:SAM-dependent methyltransferase [Gluconacetobacter diazotrophicus]